MLAKFPRLEAPLSMFNTPPAPKGFDDKDDGPHAIDAPMNKSNLNTKMTMLQGGL